MSTERELGALEARISNLEEMTNEVRQDVKSLLQFRAAWLAVTGFISAAVAGIVTFIAR